MTRRRNGCGCLLLLAVVGAVVGGPTIFGKTEDAVVTAPAPVNSSPSSTARTSPPPTTTDRKSAPRTKAVAPRTAKAPKAPKATAPAKPPRIAAVPLPPVPRAAVPNAYYANCKAVRAAGAAPLYRGQPGYRSALDSDDDGVACET